MKRLWRSGLLLFPAFGQTPRADWNLRDHIPLGEVVVQSHRGAGVLSPENSVEAFEIAWRHGILFQVLPWQSSDPKLFWKLMDLGVASFATDYPDAAMQAIRDYYAQPGRR